MKVTPETFICESKDVTKSPNNSLLFKILIDHIQLIGNYREHWLPSPRILPGDKRCTIKFSLFLRADALV